MLEGIAMPFSRGSSQTRDGTQVSLPPTHQGSRTEPITHVTDSSLLQLCRKDRRCESGWRWAGVTGSCLDR